MSSMTLQVAMSPGMLDLEHPGEFNPEYPSVN
jgi:hypothetical protein